MVCLGCVKIDTLSLLWGFLKKIKKIMKRFLWSGIQRLLASHWNQVCKQKIVRREINMGFHLVRLATYYRPTPMSKTGDDNCIHQSFIHDPSISMTGRFMVVSQKIYIQMWWMDGIAAYGGSILAIINK